MKTFISQSKSVHTVLKVLLVEDNFADAELIEEFLSFPNLNTRLDLTQVNRLGEAIKILNLQSFDAILLDISLPDSKGFDTVARLREYSPNIPIVVLTALDDEEIALKSIQAGAEDYLVKRKIDSQLLIRSLRYAIERQQARETRKNYTKSTKKRIFTHGDGNKVLVGTIRDIANYKRQELQKISSIQQAILNSANYAIISTEINGKIALFNTAAERLLGYKAEELLGVATPAIFHDPDEIARRAGELSRELGITIEPNFEVFIAKAQRGKPEEREWTFIRKDGYRFPVSLSITTLRDDLGNITGFLEIARDITETEQTKKVLQQTEARLQRLADNLPGMLYQFRFSANGEITFIYVSSGCRELYGVEPEEILQNPNLPFANIHPDERLYLEESLRISAATMQPWRWEWRQLTPAGEIKWLKGASRPQQQADGNIIWDGLLMDITELKETEEALKQSEATNNAILNAIPDMMFRCQLDGTFIDFKPAKNLETVVPPSAFIGKKVQDVLPLELARKMLQLYDRAIFTSEVQILEYQLPVGNRMGDFEARIVSSENNELISIVRDISDRKQAEVEIRLLLAATQAISQAQDFDAALAVILRLVCRAIGWDVGEAWSPSEDGKVLQYSQSWYEKIIGLEEFHQHSQTLTFARGIGLPGRIWQSHQPEWIEDVSSAENRVFLRGEIAAKAGLKAGFGLPIIVDDRVLAVLIFFKQVKTPEETRLVELVNAVAAQLGTLIQRKQTEAALQLSQERLQMALQGSALGYWDWNIAKGTTYFDPQWKRMLGYEVWEVENNYQSWERLIHPEDLPRVLQVLSDYLQGNTQFYEVEFRMLCKAGQWKWIVAQGKVFDRDRAGNPVRMAGTHRDVSERKQVEEESFRLASQLQEAQKIAHIGNWEFDITNGTIGWSDELFRIFGRKKGKAPNFQELLQQIHPEEREDFACVIKMALENGIPYDIDYRILHPNGEIKYINSKSQALLDRSGQVVRLFGTAMDITDRKLAEETLRQQFLRERLVGTILERIRHSLNLPEVLKTAVEEVRKFLQTDRVIIYHFHSDWNGKVVVESVGEGWTPTFGIDIKDNCFKENYVSLYQQGRIRIIDDIYHADLSQCHIDLLTQFQVKANLVVPILQAENLWGLLIAHHCSGVREWQSSEIESLKQLSVQLAIAIQQSMLFEQAKTEIAERKAAEIALRQSEGRERSKAVQLEFTLHKLRSTQAQLVQNEKMAALGQLVAGIAHEINNPVTFIYGNISPAMQYAADLINLISLYQQYYPHPAGEIVEEIEAIELEFLKDDFQKLLVSMQEGALRIKDIVLSLRNFSRLDEADKKEADLHSGLNSTLLILQNRLKEQPHRPAIQVIKEFGKLPLVECYPGQLNQVFINILTNAIDALEEKLKIDTSFTPTIKISTESIGSRASNTGEGKSENKELVIIRITDNGTGISNKIKERLFDPFFTTKPVGKGTGLGLSISYQIIVEKHRGKLKCNSQPGEGTEFAIELSTRFAGEIEPTAK